MEVRWGLSVCAGDGEFLSHWGVKKESPVLFVTVSLCLAVSGSCLHAAPQDSGSC